MRQVAQGEGVYLLDLEASFASLPDDSLKRIFMEDGIHFTDEGVHEVAIQIAEYLETQILETLGTP